MNASPNLSYKEPLKHRILPLRKVCSRQPEIPIATMTLQPRKTPMVAKFVVLIHHLRSDSLVSRKMGLDSGREFRLLFVGLH